jgi:hypothetical protein
MGRRLFIGGIDDPHPWMAMVLPLRSLIASLLPEKPGPVYFKKPLRLSRGSTLGSRPRNLL